MRMTLPPVADLQVKGTYEATSTASLRADLDRLFEAAHEFFSGPEAAREAVAAGAVMTGWRRIGIEYSQDPARPDLNETFCYRRHDDRGALVDHPLLAACRAAQLGLDRLAAEQFASIAESLDVENRPPIRTSQESWLQLNFSRPSVVDREFIQDAHEDGHLLTILVADAPGLEVFERTAGWRAVCPDAQAPIVFAGECGALLTADRLQPTPHRVRAHRDVAVRLSMAYFVNPDLDQRLDPWIWCERNRGVDLLRWGQTNPARFGLPVL